MAVVRVVILLLLACLALGGAVPNPEADEKHWAVLVAGSATYMNYRHQADVCHAYQILKKHGIPDERIIVFMKDDIAENRLNPDKGVIINAPDGPNVYTGVPKDYTGEEVTPENFLNVITGQKALMANTGSGKVLESGPKDHVFINFVDHGAPGFVAFPRGTLSARELASALEKMHEKKMYKQLVFYMEACESGSMFAEGLLPADLDIFATTAANPHESSYACYYDKKLRTFLGDVYSIKWMEDTDKVGTTETLAQQFATVKKETTTSHVQEYGDMKFTSEQIQEFLGGAEGTTIHKALHKITAIPKYPCKDAVASPNVPLAILYHQLNDATTEDEKKMLRSALAKELMDRNAIAATMDNIIRNASNSDSALFATVRNNMEQPQDFDCAEAVVREFSAACYDVSAVDYAFRQVYALVNMCEKKDSFSTTSILNAISSVCHK